MQVTQSSLTLCDPMDYTVHGILQARILEWVAFPFSRGSSQLRDHRCPTLQADSLPAEPQGKPKNTGVGSLSLLEGIFPTQELNRGLLHCRQILYQMSYQGSRTPSTPISSFVFMFNKCFLTPALHWHSPWCWGYWRDRLMEHRV